MEKALIISQETSPNSSIGNVGTGDENCNCNDKELFASKSNSLNDKTNLQKDNTNEANKNKTAHNKTCSQRNNGNNSKRQVVVPGYSMLNGINERGLSKHQNVKIQNFPGGTTEIILDKVEI